MFMKIILVFLGLCAVSAIFAQTAEKRVYINPSFGGYRVTTDPNNINNTPFMFEGKIGTDIGKHGIIGLQFSRVHQNTMVSGLFWQQPVAGPVSLNRYGKLTHQITALGVFYERIFPLGKRVDLFPSAYIQYLDFKEVEKGNVIFVTDSSMTYERKTFNNYSARVGVNFNMQYKLGKSFAITMRLLQIDCRIWDESRKNISGELPFLIGVKFSY